MKRMTTPERPNWRLTIAEQGLLWHTDSDPFWREGTYYEFTMPEIERIESATDELYAMCLEAGQHLMSSRTDAELNLPLGSRERILGSFRTERDHSIYARFDLRFDPQTGSVGMYEINGDTPTMLVESAVAQWFWKNDVFGQSRDQFNSIHERLVGGWRRMSREFGTSKLWLTGVLDLVEEAATLAYLSDTATEAEMLVHLFDITDVGLTSDGRFVDDFDTEMGLTFKLYPLEDMLSETFGPALERNDTRWIEPLWKQALSHKGLLAALSEIYPGHELLIPAAFDPDALTNPLPKPFFGREGEGMVLGGEANDGVCYQEWMPPVEHDGRYPVLGSWVIDGMSAGMGIRETAGPITDTHAQFVPHVINAPEPDEQTQAEWLEDDGVLTTRG